VKRAIVEGLERACGLMDRATRNHLPCYLGSLSGRLEERWQTGYWQPVSIEDVEP
jgi:hypothetical protein